VTDKPEYEPNSNYTIRKIEGWKVYVNYRLIDENKKLCKEALRLMRVKLYDINRVVPKPALKHLHKVSIWLEFNNEQVLCACYHPSEQWLIEHNFSPEKAKSVEIGNAVNFLEWTLDQPSMVLHEMAHAYHHQFLGYDNAEIKFAYDKAVEAGIYESVLRYNGGNEGAYSLNNDQEYFAEQTEAYFGTNDYYPFVRAELMKHDHLMYETLKKLWGD
jgi:hypothetical protein